jgi:anthranilate synthase/aminodeoxychorismate synthase-like glutamine amidotransferase
MSLIDEMQQQSGDRLLFLSGGPKSHLAKHSMLANSFSHRLLIIQPSLQSQKPHSPLRGECIIDNISEPLNAVLQIIEDGTWVDFRRIRAKNIAELFRSLKEYTPLGQRWAGALSYDLLQWTQPIRLQNPPKDGSILGLMWLVDSWREDDESFTPEVSEAVFVGGEKSSHDDLQHEQEIEKIRSSIISGELYQLNFGRKWNAELLEQPSSIFKRLAATNPAPFSAYIEARDLGIALVSSSPEILLKVEDGEVMTAPIKGTRPRGSDFDQEEMLRKELLFDQKERAEHRMLVDLERNELSMVCQIGSVKQSRFDVEAYANVQHLVSQISGTLSADKDGLDALQAVFPGGSITGCPKTVVCAAIDEIEGEPRSFWTGSAGWIDVHSGDCTWNILIRTLEARCKNGSWHGVVMAGGGITIESEPKAEVAEAIWKAAALRRACGWLERGGINITSGELMIHPQEIEHKTLPSAIAGEITHWPCENPDVIFIDNLDSFSYNIIHLIANLGRDVTVVDGRGSPSHLADDIMKARHIVIGPGPGRPEISPISMEIAKRALSGDHRVLGICLGHQALGLADGMELIECPSGPVHGVPEIIKFDRSGLFSSQGEGLMTRYNSLILSGEPTRLEINITDASGHLIMGLTDDKNVHGLQFHPESIGSVDGCELIAEFLRT